MDKDEIKKVQDRKQIIIEGLITTLGYREQLINELQNENIALKARMEMAERRVKILLEKIDGYEAVINKLKTRRVRRKRPMTHCENCRFWQSGYCTLHKQETNDGTTCDKAQEV